MNGASHTRTFFQMMPPMAKPGLISVGIFNFLGQWNQYMLHRAEHPPTTAGAPLPGPGRAGDQSGLQGRHWSGLFAGLVMAMLPVLAAYISTSSDRWSRG